MTGLSAEAHAILCAAGWFPERHVDTAAWNSSFVETGLQMPPPAAAFLGQFGGLAFDLVGSGATHPYCSCEIDPMVAWHSEEERFVKWSRLIGRNIFPTGELDRGRALLGMDESAELYLVSTTIASFGRMPLALDNLICGIMPRAITAD
jgi:hypothetical protein